MGSRSQWCEIIGRGGDVKRMLEWRKLARVAEPAGLSSRHRNDIVRNGSAKNSMSGACDNVHLRRNIRESAIRSLALCPLGSAILAGSALADTSAKKIAFSNNYAGNSWR